MGSIAGKQITFAYGYDDAPTLNGVDISVKPGQLVAILGRNGCGKSTLVRHFNALLALQEGELSVAGIDVRDEAELWRLRRTVGMVFQNPDNQFVSSLVGEDVAFGLENYQVPRSEIPGKVSAALEMVGLAGFEERSPHLLSGGQKQRAALAGVLALEPEILVLDEATAMLDPVGRREILAAAMDLRMRGTTVIMITHIVEEAIPADLVFLMNEGKMIAAGTPEEVLTVPELLEQAGLAPPLPVRLYHDLRTAGIALEHCPLTAEALAEELCRLK